MIDGLNLCHFPIHIVFFVLVKNAFTKVFFIGIDFIGLQKVISMCNYNVVYDIKKKNKHFFYLPNFPHFLIILDVNILSRLAGLPGTEFKSKFLTSPRGE